MSYADELYKKTCRDILENGFSDENLEVRPHWEDGTPAHTIKKFGVVNRYNLAEEFPIMTLRRTYWKSAVDELLWIWQKKSNRVADLGSHVWDEWVGEDGTIGKAYGYQLGIKHQYKEGMFDQVDRVIYDLKHNPASRRILTNIYNFEDLHEMNLYPCAYSMTFNVTGDTLNAILNQRSQDMLTANNWNVVQYAVLTHMMAQVAGLKVGHRRLPYLRPAHSRRQGHAGKRRLPRAHLPDGREHHGLLRLYQGQLLRGKLSVPPLQF